MRPTSIDSKKQKPRIFIGSSIEALKYAEAIKAKLQDVASFTIWRRKKNWQPGLSILESLIKLLSEHDFAVLILDADDVTKSREQVSPSPRDNVIFELGLFMGYLGRCRTFFLCRNTIHLKIPSDLKGITSILFAGPPHQAKRAVAGACQTIRYQIKKQGVYEPLIKDSRHVGEAVFKWMNLSPDVREKLARSQLIGLGGTRAALNKLVESANTGDSILAICGYKGSYATKYYEANFKKCKTVRRVFSYQAIRSEITSKRVCHALDGLKMHLRKLDNKATGRCKVEVSFIPEDKFIRDLGDYNFDPPLSFGLTILRAGKKLKKAIVHWEMDAQLLRDLMAIEGIVIDDGQQEVLSELLGLWEAVAGSEDVLSSKSKTGKNSIMALCSKLEETAAEFGCRTRKGKA